MFRAKRSGRGIPTSKEIGDLFVSGTTNSLHPTKAQAAALHMPDDAFQELTKKWNKLKKIEPPLQIEGEPRETSAGITEPILAYHGTLRLGVRLFKDDDAWETEKYYAQIFDDDPNKDEELLKKAWHTVAPVITIVANDKPPRPNQKCPCGSGKKYKKCCIYKETQTK